MVCHGISRSIHINEFCLWLFDEHRVVKLKLHLFIPEHLSFNPP